MNYSVLPAYAAEASGGRDAVRGGSGVYTDLSSLMRLEFKAHGFSLLPRQPVHSVLAGRHASRLRGRGLNFEELRGYRPGDDIRSMDWRATARLRTPQVRVYTEERDRPTLLLVDQRRSMFFGTRRCMKSVVAAEAAAVGAWRVFHSGDRVGAIVFSDTEIVELPPHRSRRRVMQILEAIARLNRQLSAEPAAAPNPGAFNEALRRAAQLAKHDVLVCTVSDGFGLDPESGRLVTQIAAHNDLMVLFIYDLLEEALPRGGRYVCSQGRRQLEVDAGSAALQRDYAADFLQRQTAINRFCRQRQIPRLSIGTHREAGEQVREQLGQAPGASTRRSA